MIETLQDWNDRLAECGCCEMPECCEPELECISREGYFRTCGYDKDDSDSTESPFNMDSSDDCIRYRTRVFNWHYVEDDITHPICWPSVIATERHIDLYLSQGTSYPSDGFFTGTTVPSSVVSCSTDEFCDIIGTDIYTEWDNSFPSSCESASDSTGVPATHVKFRETEILYYGGACESDTSMGSYTSESESDSQACTFCEVEYVTSWANTFDPATGWTQGTKTGPEISFKSSVDFTVSPLIDYISGATDAWTAFSDPILEADVRTLAEDLIHQFSWGNDSGSSLSTDSSDTFGTKCYALYIASYDPLGVLPNETNYAERPHPDCINDVAIIEFRYRWKLNKCCAHTSVRLEWDEVFFPKEYLAWEAESQSGSSSSTDPPVWPTVTHKAWEWSGTPPDCSCDSSSSSCPSSSVDPFDEETMWSPWSQTVAVASGEEGRIDLRNLTMECVRNNPFGSVPQLMQALDIYVDESPASSSSTSP